MPASIARMISCAAQSARQRFEDSVGIGARAGRAAYRAALVAAARRLTDGPSYRARDRAFPDLARPTSSSRPRTQRRLLRIETNPLDVNGAPFAAARAGLARARTGGIRRVFAAYEL